ncbi:MAG: RNA methyltransferase [Saprospiraceae bacterium]|nr:RNA methyltransferase [Saprospiraceae bacterium]
MRKLKLEELGRPSLEQFKHAPKRPIVLVLDSIRSGLNVGSIFRTADAFALREIHLCGITAKPPHREILKTAIGATDSIPWTYHHSIVDCIRLLKTQDFEVIGVEQTDQSVQLNDFQLIGENPVALVFGNEVGGIDEAVLPLLDYCIEVPQWGTKHSINVAVCAGIVIWHLIFSGTTRHL